VGGQQTTVGGQQTAVGGQQTAVGGQQTAVGGQGSGTRTISIKPENHVPRTRNQEPGSNSQSLEQTDFTQEKLEKIWVYYTESIAGQYPNFYSILSTRKPTLKENYLIHLQLDNRTQEITLNDRRADLLDFLRNELRNQRIQMESSVIESASQAKPYTADEKYRSMVEKNPELKALRDGLDLEMEL
jgi:hypothetical protein